MTDKKHYKTKYYYQYKVNLKMKLILIIFLAYLESSVVRSDAAGYYWRDYYGEIPDDAFQGGSDLNGGPIYIGQSFGRFLVPSKIYGSTKKVYYELAGTEYEGENAIKILCTQHPEQLEWIQTDNDKIKLLTYGQLILGGYEPGCTTYIGRVRSNGEVLVGKALADNRPQFAGFWSTSDGKIIHSTTFEVLSLNRNAPPIIDARFGNQEYS